MSEKENQFYSAKVGYGSNAGYSGMRETATTDVVTMPEVVAETQELHADIEHIQKLVIEVETRFGYVLQTSVPPIDGQGNQTATEPRSPLGRELRGMRCQTENIRQHLQMILSRCEIG